MSSYKKRKFWKTERVGEGDESCEGRRRAGGSKMIKLSDTTPFAHGNHRKVYRHPDHANRCLKVMTEDWRQCDRRKRANVIARLERPRWHFHENESELHFSTGLGKRVGSAAWNFVARAHGIMETGLGPALEVDLITDHDDGISLTLKEHVWRHGLTPECKKALEEFWQRLDEHSCLWRPAPITFP